MLDRRLVLNVLIQMKKEIFRMRDYHPDQTPGEGEYRTISSDSPYTPSPVETRIQGGTEESPEAAYHRGYEDGYKEAMNL